MAEDHEAEKKKLLEGFEAEKQKVLEEHRNELEEKEQLIFEARQAAQEAERTLRRAEGDHIKIKKSLELTGVSVKKMEAQQKSWTKFLRLLDNELSRKSSFPSATLLFFHYILTYFLRYYR